MGRTVEFPIWVPLPDGQACIAGQRPQLNSTFFRDFGSLFRRDAGAAALARMATNFLTKIFGSRNDRLLKQYRKTVARINALEPELEKLSDEQLRAFANLLGQYQMETE